VIRALLWDVDGTLAETERDGHLAAFRQSHFATVVCADEAPRKKGPTRMGRPT
jgi:phosphoglycolate phosphatase-like HAD superfamily hydrolase